MNPIKRILKQRDDLLISEENLRKRKKEFKSGRNRLTTSYYSFYRFISKSSFGKSISGYVRFLFTDLWILNYTVLAIVLMLVVPTVYITCMIEPDLLENIYVLGLVLFFPLVLIVEWIRYLKFGFDLKNIPFSVTDWISIYQDENISQFQWAVIRVDVDFSKNKEAVIAILESFSIRANRLFYRTLDKDIRKKWDLSGNVIEGSANSRIILLLLDYLIKPLRSLESFESSIRSVTITKVSESVYLSSLQNDGSSD
ncbi:hypothetical protein [Leptospira ilyithenensis]|uniref:Uncharacterized protein n=1 Tax=Leptospira ilyithenensis TaxID=2484901 RepID=A0A4R9LRD0_9LEPT|nr:hypothetical protein [Leptospira ilyithenensis]TGN13178.1 hypothetical protein EHS11_04590 [Leptospira ilyithenensis]